MTESPALVIPPGDVDALVHALQRLGSDAALRSTLGTAGKTLADSRFSVEDVRRRLRPNLSGGIPRRLML